MNTIRKINTTLDLVLKNICILLLLIFTLIVLLQILTRNYIKVPMAWTAEVALFCFLWSVYLGAAVAVRSRQHYVVELLPTTFVRTKAIMTTFSDIAIFSLILVLICGGIKFTQMGFYRFLVSLPLSMAWLFVAIPISGMVMFLFGIENVVDDVNKLKKILKGSA